MNETPITVRCADRNCDREIHGEVVWLGERYDGVEKEWPFHPKCADQPWPLYETRRSTTKLSTSTGSTTGSTEGDPTDGGL